MEQFVSSRPLPFPFVLECVDGMHIRIQQHKTDSISYYNKKGTFPVVVQAIADSKMRFTDVSSGDPR